MLPKLGHSDDFWAYEPDASTRLIDTFLDTGRVDTSLYTDNRLDFTSSVTHSRIAEIVIGVFLGFAGLVVLSLLWLAGRLHRGAMFGRKGSVAVRSLLPLVLGFGGWCLGVLIVLVALPTVPVTDELLAVVSIAPPVALAVYAGWFRPAALSSVAAFAALSAAALGAWLGYQVPHGPGLGAVTAVVGATLAANLGLIALDIARPPGRSPPCPTQRAPRHCPLLPEASEQPERTGPLRGPVILRASGEALSTRLIIPRQMRIHRDRAIPGRH